MVDLRRSKRTAYEKVWFIKKLFKTIGKKPDEISREDLRCFLKTLENFSAATYKNALMALKVFFRDFLELPEVVASFKFPHQVFKPKQIVRDLGYRLHLAVDVKSEMPVAMTVASANENEKKHSMQLFERASCHVKPRRLLADPQYSSANLREAALRRGTLPVIPYPRNQMKGARGILRIDRKFKSHGPSELRRAYRKRVAVERVFSRLKNLAGLGQHNLRGLAKITFHAQLCLLIMLFTAQAAINTHKPGRSRSIRYFAS